MGLEAKLTDKEAELIFEEKKDLLRSIGIKEEELESHLLEARTEYENYKKVLEMKPHNYSNKIAKDLNLLVSTVQSWTQFEETPLLLSKRGYFTKKKNVIKETNNYDLAFFLGTYSGSKKNPLTDFFGLSFREKKLLENVAGSIYHLTKLLPQIYPTTNGWKFHYTSEQFANFFQKHTINNTVVPWQLFNGNMEGKTAYLQGFLSTKSSVTTNTSNNQPGITIDFSRNKELLKEVAILFYDLGMSPSITSTKINVIDYPDLKKIYDSGLLLAEKKRNKLERILSGFGSYDPEIDIHKFLDIRNKLNSGEYTRKETREAFVANGAKYFTAREWVSTGKTPKRVKRYLKLRKLKPELGDVDVIICLYNQFGFNVKSSRNLAKKLTFDEMKEVAYGSLIYQIDSDDQFRAKTNLLAWKIFMLDESNQHSFDLNENNGLIPLKHFFNMYVPNNYFNNNSFLRTSYIQFYRHLMANPRVAEFIKIENDHFYVVNNQKYINLVETLLSGAGLGGKKRRLNEATEITKKQYS